MTILLTIAFIWLLASIPAALLFAAFIREGQR